MDTMEFSPFEIITKLSATIEQLKGARQLTKQRIKECGTEIDALQKKQTDEEKAREIIREVGLQTQQSLQYHIGDITSLALDAVFEDPYQLRVDFVHRRNKIECDLIFVRNEQEVEPLEASGYGAVDIAAFALRVASWSMKFSRSRPIIVLDEPMRFLSQDRQPYASRMIKELSERLGIQFIIVTHEEVLSQYADKTFHVELQKSGEFKKSKIIES